MKTDELSHGVLLSFSAGVLARRARSRRETRDRMLRRLLLTHSALGAGVGQAPESGDVKGHGESLPVEGHRKRSPRTASVELIKMAVVVVCQTSVPSWFLP